MSHLKKITAMAVSTILYYRGFFPQTDYGTRMHDDTVLHILDREAETPEARQVIASLKALFESIEHKYLKTLVVGFVDNPEETDNFLEGYIFRFNYSCREYSRDSQDDVGEEAIQLLERLKETCLRLKLFQRRVYLTFKVMYFDDRTPKDYQPQGFMDGGNQFDFGLQSKETTTVQAGRLTAGQYSLKVRADLDLANLIRE